MLQFQQAIKVEEGFYLVGTTITYDAIAHYLNVNTTNATSIGTSQITSVSITPSSTSLVEDTANVSYEYSYENTLNEVSTVIRMMHAGTYTVSATIENDNYESMTFTNKVVIIQAADISGRGR